MRIITGTARGARLKAPHGLNTRPTADRVRESLFSILGARVAGRRVLDLFAGTGSLGLEALSRGAIQAVFVDRVTAAILRDNAVHTHLEEKARILGSDAFTALERLAASGERFSLVFCDPPYRRGLWERALKMLDDLPLLTEDALLVVEHGTEETTIPVLSHLVMTRSQTYGRTTQISIFEPAAQEESQNEGSLLGEL